MSEAAAFSAAESLPPQEKEPGLGLPEALVAPAPPAADRIAPARKWPAGLRLAFVILATTALWGLIAGAAMLVGSLLF